MPVNYIDMIDAVYDFNQNVVGIEEPTGRPYMLTEDQRDWMRNVLEEEAKEFFESMDVVEQIDALIDSIYFAIGGFCRMGLKKDQVRAIFEFVHTANMKKAAGKKKGRVHGDTKDATKPEGWKSPEEAIKLFLGFDKDL